MKITVVFAMLLLGCFFSWNLLSQDYPDKSIGGQKKSPEFNYSEVPFEERVIGVKVIRFEPEIPVHRVYKLDQGSAKKNERLPQWVRFINYGRFLSKSGDMKFDRSMHDHRFPERAQLIEDHWAEVVSSAQAHGNSFMKSDVPLEAKLFEIIFFKYKDTEFCSIKFMFSATGSDGKYGVILDGNFVRYDHTIHLDVDADIRSVIRSDEFIKMYNKVLSESAQSCLTITENPLNVDLGQYLR